MAGSIVKLVTPKFLFELSIFPVTPELSLELASTADINKIRIINPDLKDEKALFIIYNFPKKY